MEPLRHFAHCPRCAVPAGPDRQDVNGPFRCAACGFVLFINAASAVAGLIVGEDGRALFIRRAKDPAKGLLGMPGGFVDAGESAEDALRREVREEVGLEIVSIAYLSSHANRYPYAGVTYRTLDLFFTCRAVDPDRAAALDAVERLEWLDPIRVPLEAIAFDSMRAALGVFRARPAGAGRDG